jgi:hypothetical protein
MKKIELELYKTVFNHYILNAQLDFHLYVFGDYVAEREGYKEHKNLDALRFYLMQKHHWSVDQVKNLGHNELRFALAEELAQWRMPKSIVFEPGPVHE